MFVASAVKAAAKAAGHKRYFDGNACGKGHIAERRVSDGKCVICHNIKRKAWNKKSARMQERGRKKLIEWGKRFRATPAGRRQFLIWVSNNRAKRRGAEGSFTIDDINALMEAQAGCCAASWCRRKIRDSYSVDHIIPISRGGRNDKTNLQLLCRSCNSSKGPRTMQEWENKIPRSGPYWARRIRAGLVA